MLDQAPTKMDSREDHLFESDHCGGSLRNEQGGRREDYMKDPETADPKTTIFPTFDCFTDAMEFVSYIVREQPDLINDIILVHAICLPSENDREYAHAWVEDNKTKMAIFCGIYMDEKVYLTAPLKDFLETYHVKESTRYTVHEALKQNLKTTHYGPWEDKYNALCNDTDEHLVLGGGHMSGVSMLGTIPALNSKQKHERTK